MLLRLRRFFKKHPVMKNVISFGGMYVGAEWTQQTMLKRVWKADEDPRYDKESFARYSFFGFLWYPVIYHHWYRWLDARFVGTSVAVIGKKLLLDQFLMEPPLLASFYVGMSIMEKQEDIFKECKQKYLPTFIGGCVFWIPAMTINFWLLPNSMRVIFLGICSFIWINFICWYKKK